MKNNKRSNGPSNWGSFIWYEIAAILKKRANQMFKQLAPTSNVRAQKSPVQGTYTGLNHMWKTG